MENDMTKETNPALIDMYMKALFMRESTGNYQAVHEPSIITDIVTGKKIRVQAIGAYGILDINWNQWSKEAGLEGADWHDPKAQRGYWGRCGLVNPPGPPDSSHPRP